MGVWLIIVSTPLYQHFHYLRRVSVWHIADGYTRGWSAMELIFDPKVFFLKSTARFSTLDGLPDPVRGKSFPSRGVTTRYEMRPALHSVGGEARDRNNWCRRWHKGRMAGQLGKPG